MTFPYIRESHAMKTSFLAVVLLAAAGPSHASAQDQGAQVQSVRAGEQIILGQIMTDKRVIYARTLQLTDEESRAFWPVYDEYEAKVKKIDDRLIRLIDDYAAKYATIGDTDAQQMLAAKMKIDWERLALQQSYTRRVARVLPAIKALRYAQVEARIDNELQRKVMQIVPMAAEPRSRTYTTPTEQVQ